MSVSHQRPVPHTDAHRLLGIDHVEFYVSNVRQAMHFYRTAFGFTPAAYAGLETGVRDRVSFVAAQREVRLAVTAPTGGDGVIAEHVRKHGEGVRDIALLVDDAARAFDIAVKRGATPVMEPTLFEDEGGRIVRATIAAAFGDLVHSFVERGSYRGAFAPGYKAVESGPAADPVGVRDLDHIAISVEPGTLREWADYYINVHGFHQSRAEDTANEYSGMNSTVVQNDTGSAIFVLVEPTQGRRKSPIEEFLMFNDGPGVHHVALSCDDIVETVGRLRGNGVEFTATPGAYYDALESRVGPIKEDIGALREQHILVDGDERAYLMQIFTRPVQSRPTFFFEIIQRKGGADGFGSGNIRALFDAIARDQEMRGNI